MRSVSRRRLTAPLLGLAFAVTACGAGSTTAQAPGESGEQAPSTQAPESGDTTPAPPTTVLDISLPTVGGGQIEWNELVGQDVVLWFYAPW